MPALMDSIPVSRATSPNFPRSAPSMRKTVRIRVASPAGKRTSSARGQTRFAACVNRCAAAGVRLVITLPSDPRVFARGKGRFLERRVDVTAHEQWDAAYRAFCGRSRQPHDRGSWRILAVDRDDRVVGAITGRFFCGEVKLEYLHLLSLLHTTGPVFREHCELAVTDVIVAARQQGRTLAEISHWAVAPVWHAALIGVTLMRAMGALVAAFDAPVALLAADNRVAEVSRLMRLGSAPLGLAGHSCLPPFVHHESGAWLRLLVLDAAVFHARNKSSPAADLALLRERAAFISVE
jgi:hypothetical protein